MYICKETINHNIMISKKYLFNILLAALFCILPLFSWGQKKIIVFTDPHVMPPSLLINDGTAWQNYLDKQRKMVDKSAELFSQMIKIIKTEKPDLVLIPGDMTKDGEEVSHEYIIAGLRELLQQGIPTYVIPGNHDINNPDAVSYNGNTTTKVATVTENQFASLYADYGYSGTTRDPNSLSYCCEPIPGLVLIGIDSYSGGISDVTVNWICQQARSAAGKQVIAIMHHGLIPHFYDEDKFSELTALVNNHNTIAKKFADAGIKVVFTGHFHISDISKETINGNEIYDVSTGSPISYPCDYRIITWKNNQLSIITKSISSCDQDPDFSLSYAKNRLHTQLVNFAQRIVANNFDEMTANLINNLNPNPYEALANAFIINAQGNEELNTESSSALDNLTGFFNITELMKRPTKGMITSMLENESPDTLHCSVVNDRTLTIALPTISGITTLSDDKAGIKNNFYYTIEGFKVTRPTKRGVYIHNGKKIIY